MNNSSSPDDCKRPVLVYDGECGFCQYWVNYWQILTGDKVDYKPYQIAAKDYLHIPIDNFKNAVQYIAPDGKISSAAEASFRVLNHAEGKGEWLWMYRYIPGFKAVTEFSYHFISKRRPLFSKITRFLWGNHYEPPNHELVSWLFLRLLGLIFLSAFISFGVQAQALIGSHGLLPLHEYTTSLAKYMGPNAAWSAPMVFWWNDSDTAITAVSWGGAAFSLMLIFGILPRLSIVMLYVLYLSVTHGGQRFMTFQWDILILEMSFLAFILMLKRETGILLLRWLAFRFIFASGLVKIASGDETWRNMTALYYHFETQPLPTPLAYYVHQWPDYILQFGTEMTLFVELFMAFLIFMPRNLRFASAWSFMIFQACIILTGNYNFFNFSSMLLCLPLFDDAALRKIIPLNVTEKIMRRSRTMKLRKPFPQMIDALAFFTILISILQFHARFYGPLPQSLAGLMERISPFEIVSVYGPFSVMTRSRPEIIVEGSNDGVNWREYEFKYKPGNLKKGATWNIPHQPRVDWQFWFAAMDSAQNNPWLRRLMERLLQNEPVVTKLLAKNPFPDQPPVFIRARLYDYHFTTPEERKETGNYWTRSYIREYFPEARLGIEYRP